MVRTFDPLCSFIWVFRKVPHLRAVLCGRPPRRALELHTLAPDAWFSDGVAYPKPAWLCADLLPKLVRWAAENRSSEFSSTLSLLPVERYSLAYQRLKDKYRAMVKVKCCKPFLSALQVLDGSVIPTGLAGGDGS